MKKKSEKNDKKKIFSSNLFTSDGMNLYLDPFHQCKVPLNTICSEMKSTSRVELFYLFDMGNEQVLI